MITIRLLLFCFCVIFALFIYLVLIVAFRSSVSSGWSNHRVQGQRALSRAGVAATAQRGRITGPGLRSRDDGEWQWRSVGEGRLRVEP